MNKKVFILIVILVIICVGIVTITEGFRCTDSYSLDASGHAVIKRVCPDSTPDPKMFLILLIFFPIVTIWNRGFKRPFFHKSPISSVNKLR